MVVIKNNLIANLVNIGSLILVTILLTILIIVIIKAIIEDIEFACEMRQMRNKKGFWSEEKVQQRNTQKQIDLLETENQKLIKRITELEKENKDLKEDLKW